MLVKVLDHNCVQIDQELAGLWSDMLQIPLVILTVAGSW